MLPTETLYKIELAARKEHPNEMCGIVLHDNSFIPLQNISNKPDVSFEIAFAEYYPYEKDVKYIVHSHTFNNRIHPLTPSMADLDLYHSFNKPLLICGYVDGQYYQPIEIPPKPNNNYINRPYIFGVQDCGVLTRDFYHFEFGITFDLDLRLSLVHRRDWPESVKKTLEMNNLAKLSKDAVFQKGDIIVISIQGGFGNHICVYIDKTTVLNQGEYSHYEKFENVRNKICAAYRHPLLMEGML